MFLDVKTLTPTVSTSWASGPVGHSSIYDPASHKESKWIEPGLYPPKHAPFVSFHYILPPNGSVLIDDPATETRSSSSDSNSHHTGSNAASSLPRGVGGIVVAAIAAFGTILGSFTVRCRRFVTQGGGKALPPTRFCPVPFAPWQHNGITPGGQRRDNNVMLFLLHSSGPLRGSSTPTASTVDTVPARSERILSLFLVNFFSVGCIPSKRTITGQLTDNVQRGKICENGSADNYIATLWFHSTHTRSRKQE